MSRQIPEDDRIDLDAVEAERAQDKIEIAKMVEDLDRRFPMPKGAAVEMARLLNLDKPDGTEWGDGDWHTLFEVAGEKQELGVRLELLTQMSYALEATDQAGDNLDPVSKVRMVHVRDLTGALLSEVISNKEVRITESFPVDDHEVRYAADAVEVVRRVLYDDAMAVHIPNGGDSPITSIPSYNEEFSFDLAHEKDREEAAAGGVSNEVYWARLRQRAKTNLDERSAEEWVPVLKTGETHLLDYLRERASRVVSEKKYKAGWKSRIFRDGSPVHTDEEVSVYETDVREAEAKAERVKQSESLGDVLNQLGPTFQDLLKSLSVD